MDMDAEDDSVDQSQREWRKPSKYKWTSLVLFYLYSWQSPFAIVNRNHQNQLPSKDGHQRDFRPQSPSR